MPVRPVFGGGVRKADGVNQINPPNIPRAACAPVSGQSMPPSRVPSEVGVRRTYTVEEAAVLLGISRGSAYAAARRGELPTIRIQRRVLVPIGRLHELLGIQSDDGPVYSMAP
jgi:excisionase family DNA binding protein